VTSDAALYLDACATTPLLPQAQDAMALAQRDAWANPSSLHGFGLAASESLERARLQLGRYLGTVADAVLFCSGATESIDLALLGAAAQLQPGRLLISAVEHPAVVAAAQRLTRRGWQLQRLPVDGQGRIDLLALEVLLEPPTRLVSVIWGQSEVGTVQPLEAIGDLCRRHGVLLHSDAVQMAPHVPIHFDQLPVDLLSLTAHKLGGPRGIGCLLVRPGLKLQPRLGGGAQERGLRAGTEPVVLAAGFAAALEVAQRAHTNGEAQRVERMRNRLLAELTQLDQVQLSGPDPSHSPRLPHHISVMVQDRRGGWLPGRQLVRALWRQGIAASSGSACSAASGGPAASPVLQAMGFDAGQAASGLRLSLGPWLQESQLGGVCLALDAAIARCGSEAPDP